MHQKMWLGRSNCETNVRQQPGGRRCTESDFLVCIYIYIYIYIYIDHIYVPALVGGGVAPLPLDQSIRVPPSADHC